MECRPEYEAWEGVPMMCFQYRRVKAEAIPDGNGGSGAICELTSARRTSWHSVQSTVWQQSWVWMLLIAGMAKEGFASSGLFTKGWTGRPL